LQPLSAFLGQEAPAALPRPDFPEWVEGSQFDERAFTYLDFVMDLLEKPPGAGEEALWKNLARLEIGPGSDFRLDALSKEQMGALKAGVKEGVVDMQAFIAKVVSDPLASGKIFGTREFLTESARKNYNLDKPYTPQTIARHSGLGWNKGRTVILLDDAEGNTWIMKGFELGLEPQYTYDEFLAALPGVYHQAATGRTYEVLCGIRRRCT
jgi:hypothetical protein